jgi:glycosyltransferase involved in cell wall biosynthesis
LNILYLSCHSINEYEDIKLFTELGHNVLSQGSYKSPENPEEKSRPPIPEAYRNEELKPLLHLPWGAPIPKPLIDWSDVIYILGIERWLPTNWEKIKHKHVIFRSIGQSVENTEKILSRYRKEGLKIVRYSPLERNIPSYSGEDAMIRFYKDPDEYNGWSGEVKQVITVAQAMKKREPFLKFHIFEKITRGFPRVLYGYNNDDVSFWGGELSYEELKKVLRENRVYVYTGTEPAPYTMAFIEALMVGIPIVSIGQGLAGYNTFEIPYLIENSVDGFVSDSLMELRGYVSMLLEDYDLAKRISKKGREKAIELFSKQKIKEQWREFFESLC